MKKALLTALSLVALQGAASAQNYNFAHSNSTYAPLTNTTSVSGNTAWDDDDYTVQIGFAFTGFGGSFTEAELNSNGYIGFISASNEQYYIGYNADLESELTSSPIVTSMTGTPGNRIRKFEWINSRFYSSANDVVNFQIWLHEADGKMETHIGPTNVSSPNAAYDGETGPATGVIHTTDMMNFTIDGLFVAGNPAMPTVTTIQDANDLHFMNGVPANGKVFSFTPGFTATADVVDRNSLQLFPNPCTESFAIRSNSAEPAIVHVFDQTGRLVSTQQFAGSASISVDMTAAPAGFYLVEMLQNNIRSTQKLLKQ